MLTGMISGQTFSDSLYPYLDRTMKSIISDETLSGNLKPIMDMAILPPVDEMDEYIYSGKAESAYSSQVLSDFRVSQFRKTLDASALYKDDVPSGTVICCEQFGMHQSHPVLAPSELMELIASPPVLSMKIYGQRAIYATCPIHKDNNGRLYFPVVSMGRTGVMPELTDGSLDGAAITIMDLAAMITRRSRINHYVFQDFTVLEVMNAYGIEASNSSAEGFNITLMPHTNHLEELRRSFGEIAPKGELLVWIMLAGWRSGSARVIESRLQVTEKLMDTMSAVAVHEYLTSGVANIREIPKFVKAGISPAKVAEARSLGITDRKLIKTMDESGIDYNLMVDLIGSSW